jgi:hypothetical protein
MATQNRIGLYVAYKHHFTKESIIEEDNTIWVKQLLASKLLSLWKISLVSP